MLAAINEFNITPGTYQHYKGGFYVVFEVITHMDDSSGKMAPLEDPLVVYRDLEPLKGHLNSKPNSTIYQVYARKLSEFTGTVINNNQPIKRFTLQ